MSKLNTNYSLNLHVYFLLGAKIMFQEFWVGSDRTFMESRTSISKDLGSITKDKLLKIPEEM